MTFKVSKGIGTSRLRFHRIESVLICFMLLLPTIPAFSTQLFPLPKVLEDNVAFWIRIFTQVSTNEVVIHDAEHPMIIYKVIDLSDAEEEMSAKERWDLVEAVKDEYKETLKSLAARPKPILFDSLNRKERDLFILWAEVNKPDKFEQAACNIRGQLGLRDRFISSIQRSGRYYDEIVAVFESYDLPPELCFLPHIESLFDHLAYSRAGAAGMWQFTHYTGNLFLRINSIVDERFDPFISTEAAARLLKKNYQELQSWPMAITAYNHGLNSMKRAKRQLGTDDFGEIVSKYKSRAFGFASKNFYAEFLAACHVVEQREKYFPKIRLHEPVNYKIVNLDHYLSFRQISEKFDVSVQTLKKHNPAFRNAVTQEYRKIPKGYQLRIPVTQESEGIVSAAHARSAQNEYVLTEKTRKRTDQNGNGSSVFSENDSLETAIDEHIYQEYSDGLAK